MGSEVENIIYQLPQTPEVGVLRVAGEGWGETEKGFIELLPEQSITPPEIIDHCLINLAKFKIPESVDFIEALPRNVTGKALENSLRDN